MSDARQISEASDKFAKGNLDKQEGFDAGATWGLERANARIEELESKLKLADRNNELLRGHRDQLEAQYKVLDGVAGKIEKERQELEEENNHWRMKLNDALQLSVQKPEQGDDIIPEDYYIK